MGLWPGTLARAFVTPELLASALGLVVQTPKTLSTPGTAGAVAVTGFTDSLMSFSVVARDLLTPYPLCVVAMELAAQLEL